jgi:hypothetical protein
MHLSSCFATISEPTNSPSLSYDAARSIAVATCSHLRTGTQLYKTSVTCENAETKRRSGFYTRLSDDDVTRTDEMTSLVGLSRLVNAFLHWCASATMRSAHEAMRRTRTSATIPEQAHSKQYHPKSGVVRPTPQTQAA